MSRSAPRRRAETPSRASRSARGPRPAAPRQTLLVEQPDVPAPRAGRLGLGLGLGAWLVVVLAGATCLVLATLPVGPAVLSDIGAVTVTAAYTFGLARRTGGRPWVFGALAVLLGVAACVVDTDASRTGAAVMACAVSAVFAVMVTVPAVRFPTAVRECLLAVAISVLGGLATIGLEPVARVSRFEYAVLALALVAVFALVYRLGAGLHGLGRRGVVLVVIGGVLLVGTLLYAELLRRYGTHGLVMSVRDAISWSRAHLGAFPRPVEAALGIPALVWGCHMRARRRQGWWVCAFGVAGTAAVANALVNPSVPLRETELSVLYGLVIGLLLGYVVIRIDLAVTVPGGSRRAAGRRAEEAGAVRPEPGRTQPLR